ncbi:MAG TPA: type II toxin-antitoxin system PemK/MazF family toxin [Candidatus Krumholzibacteria bacterium]|nr:type II toxin-antitoxin system PemK/MazF family toxin [Candidatus Krumholzibacteria bacterium]
MVAPTVKRGDVVLVSLGHGQGGEIRKTRPCVVVSPDVLNDHMPTFIVAPMTTGGHAYPFRISCRFQGKSGFVVLDQIRTVDRARVSQKLGHLSPRSMGSVLVALQAMFAA